MKEHEMINPNTAQPYHRPVVALALALSLGLNAQSTLAQVQSQAMQAQDLQTPGPVAVTPQIIPAGIHGTGRLLIHDMPSTQGGSTRASTLLLMPAGAPPVGGWPVVAWVHGTTTPGQKTCAPSLSPDLDGGLTRDGFKSNYAYQLTELVNAGYAVVAPDLEGLGPAATVPYPYFSEASLARSMIAGVLAAREAEPTLSTRWAVFGHSEGGHGALAVEAHAAEAPGLTFLGTVASAPYLSVAATAALSGRQADKAKTSADAVSARMGQNFQDALMTVGVMAQSPSFDPRAVMGADLQRILPAFRAQCSVGAIGVVTKAIESKGQGHFAGIKSGWDRTPQMHAFLVKNDFSVTPGFTLHRPTLIVQGSVDSFVPEPLTTAFVARLKSTGAPVIYKRYPGADHFTLIPRADADVLAFLQTLFEAH